MSPSASDTVLPYTASALERVSSAARTAAEAWRAAMQHRSKSCTSPPWDEMVWFQPPLVTAFTLPTNIDVIIANANPQRIGLIIGLSGNSNANIVVRPSAFPDLNNPAGINMYTGYVPWQILQRDHPNLPQQEWHATTVTSGAGCCVIEILLRDWPR